MANYIYTLSDTLLSSDGVSRASSRLSTENIINISSSAVNSETLSKSVIENCIVDYNAGQNIDAISKTIYEPLIATQAVVIQDTTKTSVSQLILSPVASDYVYNSVRSKTDTINFNESATVSKSNSNAPRTVDIIAFNGNVAQSAVVTILSPVNNIVVKRGENLYFSARLEFDNLIMTNIRWESSIDGVFNYGRKDFYYAGLTIGSHVISVRGAEGCIRVNINLTVIEEFAPERVENLKSNV